MAVDILEQIIVRLLDNETRRIDVDRVRAECIHLELNLQLRGVVDDEGPDDPDGQSAEVIQFPTGDRS